MKIKVAILTNIFPAYREGFYGKLFELENIEVTLFCQKEIPNTNFKYAWEKYPNDVSLVNYISAKNDKVVWQFLPFRAIYKNFDVIFVDGNPRNLSHAFFATFLRIMNKKVVLWSMAHSFVNNQFTKSIRIKWLRFFKYHFLYNDSDITDLTNQGFGNKIMVAMNNGLDQEKIDIIKQPWNKARLDEWLVEKKINNRTIIASCGRLEPNKYEEMLEIMPILIEKIPDLIWIVIGDGKAKIDLEKKAKTIGVEQNIYFTGAIYEDEILAPWLLNAQLFIHPTAIGLSIMHAFGFGLPIVTHNKKEEHGPEFVAFEEGKTGLSYAKNNLNEFSSIILNLLEDKNRLQEMQQYVLKVVQEKYNTKIMTQRFVEMIDKINPM
jgi:glycosyltransferase involved in cell wall biosynthesis